MVKAIPSTTPQQRGWLPPYTGRFQSMFSATKFVVAGAIVALFGGFLLAGILTTQRSEDASPAAGASMSPEGTTTHPVMLPAVIPDGIDSGTLDTPVGQVRWVHLRGDATTLPTGLWTLVVDPSGGYVVVDQSSTEGLWRSPDLITWTPEPVPGEANPRELALDDGTYWLNAGGPASDSLWRSPDTRAWHEVDLDRLIPPGPDGYAWRLDLGTPLTANGVSIVELTYRVDDSPASLGLPEDVLYWIELTEVRPGVYEARSGWRSELEATLRFEDTGNGLRVIDDEDGTELAVLDGVSMEFIERWASDDEIPAVRRLAIVDEDGLVDLDLDPPYAMEEARGPYLSVDDSGFLVRSVTPDGLLHVHRSEAGTDWIETDIVGDDPGEPTDIQGFFDSDHGSLVVDVGEARWVSTDEMTWEPWSEEGEGGGIPIASGWISLPGHDDPAANDGSVQDTMWYRPRGGTRIPIDASELEVRSLMVDGSAGAGPLSPNTIFSSQSQDEGAQLREIWIFTFDDIPT
jgi:hypothetical protein